MSTNGVGTTARSAKPLCLNNISAPILDIIKSKKSTTFEKVADNLLADLNLSKVDYGKEKTFRRRVYDVINVLVASGIIEKQNKDITFVGYNPGITVIPVDPAAAEHESQIREKEKKLMNSIKLLVGLSLLLKRNKIRPRPPTTISLPALMFSYNKNSKGKVVRSIDGRQLTITSSTVPSFYGQIDVINKIKFTPAMLMEELKNFKELVGMSNNFYSYLLH